jgi:hypothetical protein
MDTTSKDIFRLTSCRTELRHADWEFIHIARLDILPLCGYPYLDAPVRSCRRCRREDENGYHVLNHCNLHLTSATKRHDFVLELHDILLTRNGGMLQKSTKPPRDNDCDLVVLVVGSLGSWLPSNDDIQSLLGIDGRSWAIFRRKARLAAIQGSMPIIREHVKTKHLSEVTTTEEPSTGNVV